ncbi:unnamed protein product [Nippostrongylus brasiliensis]|uniref:Kazal-like domain-containing protein n=1 Tax=Nippostrongylus brasiliensis TaxID=27835 RepID=A0A0N4XTZ8_NIPBR|nr:unnamed protein product [Nippostrongylus brasiliensis]
MKLFIIPWLLLETTKAQNSNPNSQFVDNSFYQFLQRQNEINNAILLSNAMLANSLGAVPGEQQIRLPSAIPFPATGLHANLPPNPPLFQNFPQTIPPVPTAGLHRLDIYDVLSSGIKGGPVVGAALIPIPDSPGEVVVDKIEEEVVSTTTVKAIEITPTTKPREDVYNLLKTLNLTEEETNELVSHVEKVVREEVVKKLVESRLHSQQTSTPPVDGYVKKPVKSYTSTGVIVEATTAAESAETTADQITIPLRRTKPEKELLLYLPRKKPKAEIKHHPQRIDDRSDEVPTDFVEAEILTSQMHLPVKDDEKSDDESPAAVDELYFTNGRVEVVTTPVTTTSTTTTTTPYPRRPAAHIRVGMGVNGTAERTTSRPRVILGDDVDLLGIPIITGAPLDIEAEASQLVAYRTRNLQRPPPPPLLPPPIPVPPQTPRAKNIVHPKTPFERLAVDYKERLTGAGDMDKILKTLYSNAYIALVDAKEARNVRIPLSMRRAEIELG